MLDELDDHAISLEASKIWVRPLKEHRNNHTHSPLQQPAAQLDVLFLNMNGSERIMATSSL